MHKLFGIFALLRDWIDNLAVDSTTRSVTSVCLKFTDSTHQRSVRICESRFATRLDIEGAALDVGAYRDAPAGLRIWCGATVETTDVEAMLPWLEWAYQTELNAQ